MTRSRSVRSSRGGDRFDSSDSLTMITLSGAAAEGRGRSPACKSQRSRRRRGGSSSEGFKGPLRPPKLVFHTLCTYPCVIRGSGDIVILFFLQKGKKDSFHLQSSPAICAEAWAILKSSDYRKNQATAMWSTEVNNTKQARSI